MKQPLKLTEDKIPGLIARIAIPAAVGSFFNIVYNIVDSWYAAQLGTEALAGLSLSFPVFFVFIALGFGFAGGATALIGQALGKEDRVSAGKIHWQLISLGLLISLGILLFGLSFNRNIFIWLGASGDYLQSASTYMNVLFGAAPLMLLPALINSGLNAQGITHIYRNALIAGCLANFILNPWFIYGGLGVPAMGVAGIALATVVAQTGTGLYLIYHVHKTGLIGNLSLSKLRPDFAIWNDLIRQGIPAVMNMASIGAFFFIANRYINFFGQEAIAAYGIGLRIEQLALVPSMAVNQASLTLAAHNVGAGRIERVKEIWISTLIILATLLGIGMVLLLLFSEPLLTLFTDDEKVISFGLGYLSIEAFTLVAYAFIHGNSGVLQGLKKPKAIMWTGLVRMLILPSILLPLMIDYMGFGVSSIWWMIFALSWCSGLFLFIYTRIQINQLLEKPSEFKATKVTS